MQEIPNKTHVVHCSPYLVCTIEITKVFTLGK